MKTRCRQLTVALTLFASALFAAESSYPYETFEEVIKAVGWNKDAKDAFCFVQATDLHVNAFGNNYKKGKNFITDINGLSPMPDIFVCTGDFISGTYRNPSTWPRAKESFQDAKKILSELKPGIKQLLIIGNNDCSWEMFMEVWPERRDYWSLDYKGIHFVGINGYRKWKPESGNHSGIVLDDAQYEWLKKDLAGRDAQTLALCTHEPINDADCHLFLAQLMPLLGNWTGEVWNIAGHNHSNGCVLWKLPKTTLRIVQTTTPTISWRPKKGSYRILFAENGRITGSAIRWLTRDGEPLGFEVVQPQDKWRTHLSYQEQLGEALVWNVMVGAGDAKMRVEMEKVEDRLSNLRIGHGGSLVYRIPVGAVPIGASLVLFVFPEPIFPEPVVYISNDGTAWQKPESLELKKMGGVQAIFIKDKLIAATGKDFYLKMTPPEGKDFCIIAGLGAVKQSRPVP
ncbi:MAG: metallophosphoesterase [Kiritimatiellia bacterium]|nr:metallophosphoesterase [Kiritimatiellia bacterium]